MSLVSNNLNGDLSKAFPLGSTEIPRSKALTELVEHVRNSTIDTEGFKISRNFQLQNLSLGELLSLHIILSQDVDKEDTRFQICLFDIEDLILRKIEQSPEQVFSFQHKKSLSPELQQKIDLFSSEKSRFFKEKEESHNWAQRERKIKILKVSLESEHNLIGGVGAVLLGLREAHEKLSSRVTTHQKVRSIHPLYFKDKASARTYKFLGTITHRYQGSEVRSSVYKNGENGEYVIQADPDKSGVFNTPFKSGVYASSYFGNTFDRIFYLGSSTAAFVTLYKGKKSTSNFGIVHVDTNAVGGCAFPLIQQDNKVRKDLGFPTIKTVLVMHSSFDGRAFFPPSRYQEIGVSVKKDIDLVGLGMKTCHKVVCVSAQLASELLSENEERNLGFRTLLTPDKVTAIRNGVISSNFDVENKEVYKEFALEKTFDELGNEITDYMGYRTFLKEKLHQAGIIPDPKKPLIIYIGRYGYEKGIDILYRTIKKFSEKENRDMQFVCMGTPCGAADLPSLIKLEKQESNKGFLRVYDDIQDQKKNFAIDGVEYEVSVGQLVRAAADFVMMPSHQEACGLVSMEAQCAGSFLITPFIQGFRDICKPVGYSNGGEGVYSLEQDANAICYRDDKNPKEAITAMEDALSKWAKMSKEGRNQLACRLHNDAISNYSWFYEDTEENAITGTVVSYYELYKSLSFNSSVNQKTDEETTSSVEKKPQKEQQPEKKHEVKEPVLRPPSQCPIVSIEDKRSTFRKTVSRIVQYTKIFFKILGSRIREGVKNFRARFLSLFRPKVERIGDSPEAIS